jgi:hypothetical protein
MRFLPLLLLVAPLALAQDMSFQMDVPARGNDEVRSSPNALVGQTVGQTDVLITYGRPSVRERLIFGDSAAQALVPFGETWRTGANEATVIHFSTPVRVEGEAVDAGSYALFTVPGETDWMLILNSDAQQWGGYNHDPELDVLSVAVPGMSIPPVEQLTFGFEDVTAESAEVVMQWSDRAIRFTVEPDGMMGDDSDM